MAVPRPRPRATPKDPPSTGTTGTTDTGGTRGTRGPDSPPASRPAPKSQTRRPSSGSLEKRLEDFLGAASMPFAVIGDTYSSTIIAQRTPALASALADLAKENQGVDRVLRRLLEGSAWGGVIVALLAVVIPVAQARGALPGDDPFAFMYPGTPNRSSSGGLRWSTKDGGGGSSLGAPSPPSTEGDSVADPSGGPDAPDFIPHVPGSPPGVVSVRNGAAV